MRYLHSANEPIVGNLLAKYGPVPRYVTHASLCKYRDKNTGRKNRRGRLKSKVYEEPGPSGLRQLMKGA